MINLKKIISLNLVISLIYMVFPMNVLSATVENIAEIKYKDTSNNPLKSSSNQVINQIEAVKIFEVNLIPSFNSIEGKTRGTWIFPIKINNRGQNDDSYKFSLDSLPNGTTTKIYKDINGNGVIDPEDTLIIPLACSGMPTCPVEILTDVIRTGETFPIIVAIKDDIGFTSGSVINFNANVKSNTDPTVLAQKPLSVIVVPELIQGGVTPTPTPSSSNKPSAISFSAELKKTVFPSGRAKAGGILTYYIEFTNKNNFIANEVNINDKLPKGLTVISDVGMEPTASNNGKVLYSLDGGNYSETPIPNSKFLKFSWSTVNQSETVNAYFKAKISDIIDDGSLENIATAFYKAPEENNGKNNTQQVQQTSNVMSNMVVNTIKNEYLINGTIYDKKTGLPKEGATVTVFDKDGKEVGKDITGKTGTYKIPVNGKGDYRVIFTDSNGTVISEKNTTVFKPGNNPAPIEIRGKVMDSQTKQVIVNAELKLLDTEKRVIATLKTDSEGNFIFDKDTQGKDLQPGKYIVRVVNAKGEISYARVNVSVSAGDMIVNLEILIDPFGTVYDELGGNDVRIKDASVKLLSNCNDPNSIIKLDDIEQGLPQKNPFLTDERGVYQYFLNKEQLENKNYCLSVDADGYKSRKLFLRTAPSKVSAGKYVLEVTDSENPNNKTMINNIETVPYNVGLTPLKIFDINKASNKSSIEIGDVVTYTVDATNKLKFKLEDAIITDKLPFGFKYVPNTLKVNGNAVSNFEAIDKLNVSVGSMNPNQKITIMYQTRTGIRVPEGPAINTAQITALSPKKEVLKSDLAKATVFVKKGVFSKNAAVIGKVYIDENKDGMQNANEPGVEGVSLYTAGGIRVITDSKGKYSVPDIQDGDFAIVLDLITLPKGLSMSKESQWIGQDDRSQRVFLPESGLAKVNFRLVKDPVVKVAELPREKPLKAVYAFPDKFSIKQIPYVTYPDIKGHFSQDVVEYESGLDIIHGYPDGEFKPERNISRAESTKLTLVALKSFDIKIGTTLSYIIKTDSKITTKLLDSKGNVIKTFNENIDKKAGINNIYWNGKDDKGNLVVEGNYTFEVKAEDKDKNTNTLSSIVQAIPAIPNYKPDGVANFKDVPTNHWATNFIRVGAEEKLVTGYPDDTFRPDNFIPRYEMAVIAVKALNLSLDVAKEELPFEDASDVPVWARRYVYLAYEKGLLPKYPDGKFYPSRNISRAEVAMFVNELINKQKIDAKVSGTVDENSNEIIIEGTKIDLTKEKSFSKNINKDYSEDIDVSILGLNLKSEFDDNYRKKDIKR